MDFKCVFLHSEVKAGLSKNGGAAEIMGEPWRETDAISKKEKKQDAVFPVRLCPGRCPC